MSYDTKSKPYSIAPSRIASIRAKSIVSKHPLLWGIPVAIPLAVEIVTSDWRWLVVALAIVFIVIPMILALAWLKALPSSPTALRPRTVEILPEGIRVEYLPLNDEDTHVPPAITVTSEDVKSSSLNGSTAIITLSEDNEMLIVPLNVFPDAETRRQFMALFLNHELEAI